jgi:RNA polymerase sigma-70 factor (ECF subfamily)
VTPNDELRLTPMKSDRQSDRSDAELVQLACSTAAGQAAKRAASELFARYQGRVYQWCYRYVRDREQALELAQDVLFSAYRNLGTFGERAQFSSWLFAVARNRCISALRRPELLVDEESEPEALASSSPLPDRELELEEEEERVHEMMRKHLAPLEHEALWLRCYENMPIDEITRVLGIDGATGARGVLQTARRKLRLVLGRGRELGKG